MSHDTQKADQIAFHFYTKLFYVLNDARNTAPVASASGRVDKWFNLETPDSDLWSREGREPYKTISAPRPPPPLEIQVLLAVPDTLTNNQALVYIAPDSSRMRVEPTPKYVLLESWVLAFNAMNHHSSSSDFLPSTLYKHGIPLFRSLYSLLRILPTWKLAKRLRRQAGLAVQVRVKGDLGSGVDETSIMRFDSSLALPTSTHSFQPILHPMGTLTLSSTYLTSPNFRLDELESLLSSRFMSMDTAKGIDFTPTLVKNQQRDSMLSSAGRSVGTASSLPRSPPRNILRPNPHAISHSRSTSDTDSIAERFVLPSRTATNPPLSNPHNPILPITRAITTTSTSTQPLSGLAARLRKESLQTASDTHLPTLSTQPFPSSSFSSSTVSHIAGTSAPTTSTLTSSPIATRRPGLNPVNPFRSNTLAGGNPAIGVGSSTLTGALAGLPQGSSQARSGAGAGAAPAGSSGSLTSLSSLSNLSNLPGTVPTRPTFPSSNKPSPPSFAPSSLGAISTSSSSTAGLTAGGATTNAAATGTGEIAVPPRKRYSSSFGHRYSSMGSTNSGSPRSQIGGIGGAGGTEVGSVGQGSVRSGRSAGSGSGGGSVQEAQRETRAALDQNAPSSTDPDLQDQTEHLTHDYHDDISSFMQDIDERKPLSGRSRIFASTQSPSFDEDMDEDRGERQKTIRARTRDHSREKFSFGSSSPGSGSSPLSRGIGIMGEAVPPSPLGPGGMGRRLSGGAGSSSPSSLAAPPSPRRMSYVGGAGLSPPSSPLRNAIPLAPEDDEDTGPSTTSPVESRPPVASSRPFRPPFSSSPSSVTANLPLLNTRTGAGPVMGISASPATHSSPMLTSASEVDAQLKRMNDAFLASLEGLGGSSSGQGKKRDSKGKGKEREQERTRLGGLLPSLPPTSITPSQYSHPALSSPLTPSSSSPNPFGIDRSRPRRGSASTTASASGAQGSSASTGSGGQGSEEVIGRLELGNAGSGTGQGGGTRYYHGLGL